MANLFSKRLSVVILFLVAGFFLTSRAYGVVPDAGSGAFRDAIPGEILVKLKPGAHAQLRVEGAKTNIASLDQLGQRFGVTSVASLASSAVRSSSLDGIVRIHLPKNTNMGEVLAEYGAHPLVEYAEPNYRVRVLFTPNDPDYSIQWNFDLINVPEAWDEDTTDPDYGGDASIVVAVIDTGAAYENFGSFAQAPDLASTTFTSGYDFINDDTHPNDDNGHGTHVAATIAESTNNGVGAAGIAFNSTIMPIKVLDAVGEGSVADVAAGIDFARDNGADIMNLSLGADADDGSQTLQTAVDAAVGDGILVIAATGNAGQNALLYPSAFPNVIAVGAVGGDREIAEYSNTGTNIDFVAPGGNGVGVNATWIYQQTFSNLNSDNLPLDYTTFGTVGYQGTSMASPHVAAAAALLMAAGVDPSEVEERLIDSTVDLGDAGYDTTFGHGIIDIAGALSSVVDADIAPPTNRTITAYANSSQNEEFENGDRSNDTDPYFEWGAASDASGIVGYYVSFGTDDSADPATDGTLQVGRSYAPDELDETDDPETYYLRVKARDGAGNIADSAETFTYVLDTGVSQPGGLRASSTTSGLKVSWNAVAGENVDHYNVWRASSSDGTYQKVKETAATSYTMSSIADGARYFFYVTAVDDLDNESPREGGALRATFQQEEYIVVGAGPGGGPQVRVFKADGTMVSQFFAYDLAFRGGVNVAVGDLDGNGVNEIITGAGPSGAPDVRIFDMRGNLKFKQSFMAYAATVKNGVYVGAGDLNGDGKDEIITGTGPGSGPHVRVFDRNGNPTLNSGFFAYGLNVRNGVFVTTGDLDKNGKDEIITGTGVGSGPHVRIWNDKGQPVFSSFFPYAITFRGGVRVGTGDIDGNGSFEILTSPGVGGGPIIQAFDRTGARKAGPFQAFPSDYKSGTFVAGADTDQDGKSNIIVAVGGGGNPTVKVYNSTGTTVQHEFNAFASTFRGGVNIATGVFK
ncbi:MAG: S8 family serine peptidase [Candidatus Kerfeldbacteria bacterium]|nr:S8 family serine peptidase [Candidatus Kerfeldbacteria bacterium]